MYGMVFKQGGFTLNGNILTINKGKKRFRFSYSRVYEGNVKQIRIVRETCHRYSLIIITDHNLINSYRKTHDGASIGLDFGLKTYLKVMVAISILHYSSNNIKTRLEN